MRSVDLRQLKKDPDQALSSAAEGPLLVLNGDLPEAVLFHLADSDTPEDADLKLALAAALFKDGALSLGRASRLASVSVSQLVTHLSRLGIPVVDLDPNEAEADLETLDDWLASS